MDKKGLQDLYVAYLGEEGYRGSVDKDGDVVFKYEGDTHFIVIDEEDPEYFFIAVGYEWDFESADAKTKALLAANVLNRDYKLGRVWVDLDDGLLRIDTGLLLARPEDFKPFFQRCLQNTQDIINEFSHKME